MKKLSAIECIKAKNKYDADLILEYFSEEEIQEFFEERLKCYFKDWRYDRDYSEFE